MFKQFFRDRWGEGSSKRFAGITGMGAFISMGALSGFGYTYSENLILGGLAICAGLLSTTVLEKPNEHREQQHTSNDAPKLP